MSKFNRLNLDEYDLKNPTIKLHKELTLENCNLALFL